MKRYQSVSPAILGILALFVGAWSFAPRSTAPAQGEVTPTPTSRPLSFPSGLPDDQRAVVQSLYDFSPDISSITPGSLVGSDRTALDVLWAHNYNTLQMLRVAMSRARNSRVRDEVRLLYQMRLKDQILLNQLEAQVGPAAGTSTPTAVSTSTAGSPTTAVTSTTVVTTVPTGSATAVSTSAPTVAATTLPTEQPTAVVTSTMAATLVSPPVETSVPTGVTTSTSAATSAATSEATTTGEATSVPTSEATAETTGAPEGIIIEGLGKIHPVSLRAVPILPGTGLGQLGFQTIDLNAVYLNKIMRVPNNQFDLAFATQLNGALYMALDVAREVQTTSTNPVLQSVAQHMVQENQLDLVLLQILGDRVFFDQSLRVHFPTSVAAPGQPTPVVTESATPVPSGTATDQSQEFEVR